MSHLASGYFQSENAGNDPRWNTIDAYAVENLHPPSRPNSAALTAALKYSVSEGLPDIAVSPAMGKFLALSCKSAGVTHALEVGTLGGYSAMWLATENPKLKIVTLELDPHHAKVARKNIETAGLSDRIEVIEGRALDSLKVIEKDVLEGRRERFGYTFIDADKAQNWEYFEYGVKLSRPGSLIYIDNICRRGQLCNPEKANDAGIQGTRRAIENAGKDSRVEATIIQTVGEKSYDGFLMAVVN